MTFARLLFGSITLCAMTFDRAAFGQQSALERFAVHGEVGGGAVLSDWQRSTAGFGVMAEGAGRLSVSIAGPLALQIGGGSRFFPREGNSAGQLWTVGGGVRIEPLLHPLLRLPLDANAYVGFSGAKTRFSWDASLGLQVQAHPAVGIGAFARVGFLHAAPGDLPNDAYWISGGISLSLRLPGAGADQPEPDSDQDGLSDSADDCPLEPVGEYADADRPGCPRATSDRDSDGVIDREDFCQALAAGPTPDPSRRGCPLSVDNRDSDGDGIPDRADACPRERGGDAQNPRRRGCPRAQFDGFAGSNDWATDPIFFDHGEPAVSRRSRVTLALVCDLLLQMQMFRVVSIEGHADDTGTDERNNALSQQRAQNVYDWLVANGIDASRLRVRGYGSSHPLVAGTSARARSINRRVEFVILEIAEPTASAVAATAIAAPSLPQQSQRRRQRRNR